MNIKDFKTMVKEGVKASSTYSGNKSTIHNRLILDKSSQSVGIIDSIMTTNNTVYAIVKRYGEDVSKTYNQQYTSYYNCNGDPKTYSPFELMMPIINIQLNLTHVEPKTLIGGKVLVSEINGVAMKAEYIGDVSEINESPAKISRTVLNNIRNYIGGYTNLNTNDSVQKATIEKFGIPANTLEALQKYNVSDWSGNVVRFDTDAVNYRDTLQQTQGEIVLNGTDDLEGLIRHINNKDMKTKKCHLPITLFSAR